jgi:hypothetical protein
MKACGGSQMDKNKPPGGKMPAPTPDFADKLFWQHLKLQPNLHLIPIFRLS